MLRTLTLVLVGLGACTVTPSVECLYPADCMSGICTNNRCVSEDAGRDAGADVARDVAVGDAQNGDGFVVEDTGGCVGCEADEGCFRGRCVRCTGSVLVEGCECTVDSECRTSWCDSGRCAACTVGLADCEGGLCDEDGVCSACGGDGEGCCTGGEPCLDEAQSCTAAGVCGVCGALGETCCESGCDEGAACGTEGLCVACGGLGQPPCAGDMPCNAMLGVIEGVCQRCGGFLQPCCTEDPVCRRATATCDMAGVCQG